MITESSFFTSIWNNQSMGVAISRTVPSGWIGRRYPKLYPPAALLRAWRVGEVTEAEYTEIYQREVLSKLDVAQVKAELGPDAVLLCWERTGFCHRKIVIEWLNKKGEEE